MTLSVDLRFARDWFPSRRSVLSHIGAFPFCLSGHVLAGNGTGLKGVYRGDGSALLHQYSSTWKIGVDLQHRHVERDVRLDALAYRFSASVRDGCGD